MLHNKTTPMPGVPGFMQVEGQFGFVFWASEEIKASSNTP